MTHLNRIAIVLPFFCLAACEDPERPLFPPAARCDADAGTLCTYAGMRDWDDLGIAGLGEEEVDPLESPLYLPQDVAFTPGGETIVMDWNNHRIRLVGDDGLIRTVIGTGQLGDAPDGPALQTNLNHPTHVTPAPNGHWIVSAWHNSKVMDYDPDAETITTICGNGMRSFGGDGGPAKDAILDLPAATAFDDLGAMYIVDQANQRVRKVDTDETINTVVGTGEAGFSGDGGPATAAQLSLPKGQSAPPSGRITVRDGRLYIVDSGNHRIRMVDTDGTISTIAGDGEAGSGGDGGAATAASLNRPTDLAFDSKGNLYIADTDNSCVRVVAPDGTIDTFAGACGEPSSGFGEGDGGPATEARLDRPYGVTVDPDDNVFIADTHNHRVAVVYAE